MTTPYHSQLRGTNPRSTKSVIDTTMEFVQTTNDPANTGMSVQSVTEVATSRVQQNVRESGESRENRKLQIKDLHPWYARNFLWEEDHWPSFQTSADLSEIAPPVPMPPPQSSFHPDFLHILDSHPELFKIVTLVNVDWLKFLLSDHPNQPFVSSVVRMMCEGAWSWASVPSSDFPLINDQSQDNDYIKQWPDKYEFFQ